MKIIVFISFIFLLSSVSSFSQGNFEFHFGLAAPLSDFGDSDINDDDAGGAALGINVGLKYIYPITDNGLGVFAGVDYIYNPLASNVKDEFKDVFGSNSNITYMKYMNIPLSGGLIYKFAENEKVSLFADIGLTGNFFKVTDFVAKLNDYKIKMETELANSFGLKFGGRLSFKSKTSLAISYYGLGKHDLNGKISDNFGQNETFNTKQKVDLLIITIGIRL